MPQQQIWIDTTKNRVYTRVEGFFPPADFEETTETLLEALEKVKPGFDMISDVSELGVNTPEGITETHHMFEIYVQKQIGRIVFVMGESLSRMQLLRTAKGAGLKAEVARSVEEAERMLDNPQ